MGEIRLKVPKMGKIGCIPRNPNKTLINNLHDNPSLQPKIQPKMDLKRLRKGSKNEVKNFTRKIFFSKTSSVKILKN